MYAAAKPAQQRSKPFGTRTWFATKLDRRLTQARLALLRVFKLEGDARSLSSLHFAYWVVLSRDKLSELSGVKHAKDEMLFMSDFSGDWEVYLVGFNRLLMSALDLVWGRSLDWKRQMQVNDYLRFVRRHQLGHQYYFSPYMARATVDDVRSALEVSAALDNFVFDTRSVDAEQFAALFDELCMRLGTRLAA